MECKRIVVNYRFTEKAFLSGTDKSKGELRLASIKGQLRWWYRALGGTRDQELYIFGGKSGNQILAARLHLKLLENDIKLATQRYEKSYLLALMGMGNKSDPIGFICEGSTFTLEYKINSLNAAGKNAFALLEKTIEAFGLFGSLGSRSRKGYGGIQDVSVSEMNIEEINANLNYFREKNIFISLSEIRDTRNLGGFISECNKKDYDFKVFSGVPKTDLPGFKNDDRWASAFIAKKIIYKSESNDKEESSFVFISFKDFAHPKIKYKWDELNLKLSNA